AGRIRSSSFTSFRLWTVDGCNRRLTPRPPSENLTPVPERGETNAGTDRALVCGADPATRRTQGGRQSRAPGFRDLHAALPQTPAARAPDREDRGAAVPASSVRARRPREPALALHPLDGRCVAARVQWRRAVGTLRCHRRRPEGAGRRGRPGAARAAPALRTGRAGARDRRRAGL